MNKGSPCINAGVDVGVRTDYFGVTRPSGAGYEIGASEFGSNISNAIIRDVILN